MRKIAQEKHQSTHLGPVPSITEQERLDILKYVENEEATVSSLFKLFKKIL